MKDTMNEIVKFSPFGGQLILEEVKGKVSGKLNPENDVKTAVGSDRSMYAYVPKSGCPHAKQCQVLMVLRDDNSEDSAVQLMKDLELDELAEENHFILLFPNPLDSGWNYGAEANLDVEFLVRCFAALPKSKGHVAGFNGMIFYLGTSPAANALISLLAVRSPMDAAAIMIGRYPTDFTLPEGKAEQTAWLYEENKQAENWLRNVDTTTRAKYWFWSSGLSAATVRLAWDDMFSETRRWRNDTFGTYQERINFSAKGFIRHFEDTSLGDNNGIAHTWYEYIPEKVRNSSKKVPLVFYFHGINCVALYGAEQSMWSKLAERDGFIAVFPNPSIEERWNVWDDRRIPSDVNFVMALIEHMKTVHPIDESRIYISGFSMGSMFTNALASAYPEKFAGAVACNGPHQGYLLTLDESVPGLKMMRPDTVTANLKPSDETFSPLHELVDEKKQKTDYLIPFVQFVGLLDGVGFNPGKTYPMTDMKDSMWASTVSFWRNYNHAVLADMFGQSVSGLAADNEVDLGRYILQSWKSDNGDELYYFILVKRMPHAVDTSEIELGWNIVKKYRRNTDGSLEKGD